jgi:hypothetical protein
MIIGVKSGHYPKDFSEKCSAIISCTPISALYPDQSSLLDSNILTILDDLYISRSFSFYGILNSLHFSADIFLSS